MKVYAWNEPGEHGENVIQTISEPQILAEYYPYWKKQMLKVGKASQINRQNCIDDFVTIHWAWKLV